MKRIFAIAMLLAVAGAAFALGEKDKQAAPASKPLEPLVIKAAAIKGPSGIALVHLFGATDALPDNVTMTMESLASADAMAAKVLSGELDVAVLPVNMAAKLFASGVEYPMLAVVGNGMVKLVTTDPSIRSPAELRGKQVYVAGQGATPEFLLRAILAAEGFKQPGEVELLFNMPYPEMAASLVAGKIQTAFLPEPFATIALKGNKEAREAFPVTPYWKKLSGLDDYPMTVVVVRKSLLQERPSAVAAIAAKIKDSVLKVNADPAGAGVLVENAQLGLKAAIAAAAIPASNYVYVPAAEAKSSVLALLDLFRAAAPASIGGALPADGFFAVLPNAKK